MLITEGTNRLNLTLQEQLQYAIDAGYPLHEPPAGVLSDCDHGNTIAYQLYITAGVCIPLMVVFGIFRLLNAIKFGRQTFVLDEIVFVLAFFLCFAFTAVSIAGLDTGIFGHHAWDVRFGAFTPHAIMLSLAMEIIAPLGICGVKVSVLTLSLRIFGGSVLWMRITCIVGILVLLAYHISFAIAFGAMCASPPQTGYGQIAMLVAFCSDSCQRTNILVFLMGIGNCLIDMVLLFLPLPVIWKLQMPPRQKAKTSATFLIGISACMASIFGLAMRIQYYYDVDSDTIRFVVPLHATTLAEMTAGILVCCGPSAANVFRAVRKIPIVASSMSLSFRLMGNLDGSRSRFGPLGSDRPSSSSKQTNDSPLRTLGCTTVRRKGGWAAERSVTDPRGRVDRC